ncbi:hypothetical protein [Amycolatopsis nigrescens]|uniref:hypothetical protein n=1 Tax=Amycolatopsis nigrescens TaxID=381445 RepID=UPI000369714C|nr:hypothetical protein [Amycolatopsis nigrescens]
MADDSKPWGDLGYRVYPESLRDATNYVQAASHMLSDFADGQLSDMWLGESDLGLLGRESRFVEAYNGALKIMSERSRRGSQRLQNVMEALDKAADHYETQDEADYRRLKKGE